MKRLHTLIWVIYSVPDFILTQGSFRHCLSLPLYHHSTPGAEGGNACSAWWLPETQRSPEQPKREFAQTCHSEISHPLAFYSRAVPGKQGAKPFPAGTLSSSDLTQQDCTRAAVSRAACGCRGWSADGHHEDFLPVPCESLGDEVSPIAEMVGSALLIVLTGFLLAAT